MYVSYECSPHNTRTAGTVSSRYMHILGTGLDMSIFREFQKTIRYILRRNARGLQKRTRRWQRWL